MTDKSESNRLIGRAVADRQFLWMSIFIVFVSVVCSIILAFNIHASDVTVYSRYTAFGEAHFYKSHWQYLLLFILFNLVVAGGHISIMVKLLAVERRQTALLLGWMAVVVVVVATAYAMSVMRLGQAA